MSRAVPDTSGEVSEDVSDSSSVYAAELNAACRNLQAHRSDLEHLIGLMREMRVPPQQVSGLIKQTWLQLKELRESRADLAELADHDAELTRSIERAFARLQPGESFSLDDSSVEFEQAYGRCLELGSAPELSARIRAAQARITAARLNYRRAAELYAQAATTPELIVPLQWEYQSRRALALADLGREFIDSAALEEAVDLYESRVLELAPRVERPDDWAATQHNLGNALGALGQRQRGTWMLERAIAAFESALSERSRERAPLSGPRPRTVWATRLVSWRNATPIPRCWNNRLMPLKRRLRSAPGSWPRRTGP
jgi:tetratricopeptide (TPR) repeat protein